MSQPRPETLLGTAAGVCSIVLWSTTVAPVKDVSVNLGAIPCAAYIYLISGAASLLYLLLKPGEYKKVFHLSRQYLVVCGGLFIIYTLSLYLAIGLSKDDRQAIEVSLLNYLWPGLTLALSIPILGKRGRWWLWPGLAVAFVGVVLASISGKEVSWAGFVANISTNPKVYFLGLVAAVSWALYSNLSRKWSGNGGAVPLFFMLTGIILAGISWFFPAQPKWSQTVVIELLYSALLPTFFAYLLWDYSMRNGRLILVAAISNFIPILSTVIAIVYLKVAWDAGLILGGLLVTAGAVSSKLAIRDN